MIRICRECCYADIVEPYPACTGWEKCCAPDLVTGKRPSSHAEGVLDCRDCRADERRCGIEGKWFEQKED